MLAIVSGLPGSGKSYFAEYLARHIGATYINSDQVRQALSASGRYSFKDKLAVYKEMLVRTMVALEERKDVVVDATFYRRIMRKMFVRAAEACGVPLWVIEVAADENIIRRRLAQPRKYSEADFRAYEKVRDDFEEITMPHLRLQSTDDNLKTMLKTAITYIKGERE